MRARSVFLNNGEGLLHELVRTQLVWPLSVRQGIENMPDGI